MVLGSYGAGGKSAPLPEFRHPLIYRPASLSTPGAPPFVPADIRKAYNFDPLYSSGVKGNGTRIAIIDAFGDPTLSSDLSSFDSLTGLPSAAVNTYFPDGVPKRGNSGWAVETALDVEWAHAVAPSATIDLVVALDSSLGHIFDGISFVAGSLPNETVLSMSFGLAESSYPTSGSFTVAATHQLFITITSHGTTAFASSGDSGASSCCNIQYPASDPLVVAVGGTSLFLNSDASYSSETTWSGSSAGSSIVFSKPTWQQGLGDSMRDIVDVSYDGDPNTGVLVVQGGREFQVGGTSAGAPQWAALIALASQANSMRYGAGDPFLYKISTFHDVKTGSDGFFSATVGWDYPTGMGSPDANATVKALATPIGDFTIAINPNSLSFIAGSSASSMITVTGVNGFAGNVGLSTSVSTTGLTLAVSPTTVSISASSTSGTSTLVVSSTILGTYIVTVTGAIGTLTHSATVLVNVGSATTGGGSGRIVVL